MCITQSLSVTCFKMNIRTAISNLSSWWVLIRGGAWGAWAPLFAGSGWPPHPPLFWRSGFATAHFVAQWSMCMIHTMSWMSHICVSEVSIFLCLMGLIHLGLFHSLESLSWYRSSLEECRICNLRRTSWYLGWTQSWAREELHLGRGHHP